MSAHEKLLERFLRLPKDFTWDELKRLVKRYDYFQSNKGKTSGSRVRFENEDSEIYLDLHKPHPQNILKPYQMKDILDFLKRIEVIKDETDK
jgi:predicted transcriptional regulator with HTH domain